MKADPQISLVHPRLSLALIMMLLGQTITALLWAGGASERIAQLEKRAENSGNLIERTARLEEQVIYIRASLDRIEQKLDREINQGE